MTNKNSNKKKVDFTKKEKKVKEFLLLDVKLHELSNDLVDSKYEYISTKFKFGKMYYRVKNVISSL